VLNGRGTFDAEASGGPTRRSTYCILSEMPSIGARPRRTDATEKPSDRDRDQHGHRSLRQAPQMLHHDIREDAVLAVAVDARGRDEACQALEQRERSTRLHDRAWRRAKVGSGRRGGGWRGGWRRGRAGRIAAAVHARLRIDQVGHNARSIVEYGSGCTQPRRLRCGRATDGKRVTHAGPTKATR
jgi:hypothetical protein